MRRLPLTLAIAAVTLSHPLLAQAPTRRVMTFEDILAVRGVSDPQMAPDGRTIAYVVSTTDTVENALSAAIWVARTDASSPPRRLTTGRKRDYSPRWSPDGTRIAFLSTREDRAQLFVIDPSGGEADRLTEWKTGLSSISWAPHGDRIAFLAPRAPTPAEERRQKERDDAAVTDSGFVLPRLHVMTVATKAIREITVGEMALSDVQWAPDGKHFALTTAPTTKADDVAETDVYVVSADSGGPAPRRLTMNRGPDNSPRWSPDGATIIYSSRQGEPEGKGMERLHAIPAVGGTPRQVIRDFDTMVQPPFDWSADGRTMYVTATTGTTSSVLALALDGSTSRTLYSSNGVVQGITVSRDDRSIALVRADAQSPAELHAATFDGRTISALRRLSDHNATTRALALGRAEVLRYVGPGGLPVEGILFYPVDHQPGRAYPLVVTVHGGPAGVWSQGFPASWGNAAHVWAGRGWFVFQPNPRGSVGYGEKFLTANVRDWGGGDYGDIQAGVDTLIRRGMVDSTRMAQVGWSYGGYMTAWTITQTARYKAAMVGAGLTNMVSMYSTNDLQRTLEGYFGGPPWDVPGEYEKRSAMTFIKQARTPTLIMHGQADLRVPIGQAQELYMGLRKNNVPVQLVSWPREPHGLLEPRHQLDKMRREYAWMARYVLGETAPQRPVP
jgi:dipeptidyl aminopeptidase/acylaminoacyl peptidase